MRKVFPMGHLTREVHLATVSGCASTKPDLVRWFDANVPAVDLITTKSFQVVKTSGNREPVICETSEGRFGNSVALRNPGMDEALSQLSALRAKGIRSWLNVSLSANNPENFIILVKAFDEVADSLELNFSCPHAAAGFGAAIGSSAETASDYVRQICQAYPERKSLLFVKMTPNVDNVGEIAKAVIDAGADGISAINTVTPVVHTDPVSGTPVLNNPIGGKGGQSGEHCFDRAVECIREIRAAVGDDVPVIGMGGVSDGRRAGLMIEAGADAVGIGTALAHVNQQNWPAYYGAIKEEAQAHLAGRAFETDSRKLIKGGRVMAYSRFTVVKKTLHCDDTVLITLDGDMKDFKAGQFVFLWIPGVGEKPFSVAKSEPLMFIIKKRGFFTSAVFDSLNEGDDIYIRGPYGLMAQPVACKKAVIIAGGTGEAVAFPLAQQLSKQGVAMSFLVGTSVDGNRGILEKELSEFGNYICVSDAGKPGRILENLDSAVLEATKDGTSLDDVAFYLIGPEIFMKIASGKITEKGVSTDKIILSMEKNSMCGVGLCGECSCGGRLACQWGTFMSLSFLRQEGVL